MQDRGARDSGGGSRERREIGYFNFDSNAGKPLLSRTDSLVLSSVARFEWMRSMGGGGGGFTKGLASSVSKWLLFVSCRWKNFVNNRARVFGLKRSDRDFFRAMESVSWAISWGNRANFTKWSTNSNDFFPIKDAKVFDLEDFDKLRKEISRFQQIIFNCVKVDTMNIM